MTFRNGWAQLGFTAALIAVAVVVDTWLGGGWDSVGWIAPVTLAVISAVAWTADRRRENPRGPDDDAR